MTFPKENVLAYMLFADSAKPRKVSNVTRSFPILWVWPGDETTTVSPTDGLHSLPECRFLSRKSLTLMLRHYLDLPFRVGVMSFCVGFMFTYSIAYS